MSRLEQIIAAGAKVQTLRDRRLGIGNVLATYTHDANEALARKRGAEAALAQTEADLEDAEKELRGLLQ